MGLSGSVMLDVFAEMGLTVMGEAFADRTYESDGSLRNRKFPDALITDPAQAAKQAKLIAKGKVIQWTAVNWKLKLKLSVFTAILPMHWPLPEKFAWL